MPSTDVMWQIGASVAVLLITGSAFVAWHSPYYFARIWLKITPVLVGASILIFGYQIGIWIASAQISLAAQGAHKDFAASVIAKIAVPEWVPWGIALVLWPALVLGHVARHRVEEQGRGK